MTGSVYHLHIQGPPGVGKSRFALELCRGAPWREAVIYIPQALDVRLAELIDSAAIDAGVQLVVVADEVQAEQLRPLRNSVGRGNGRVRLITVGHSPSPEPTRIPVFPVAPLEHQAMAEVVKGWYPAMPPEHVDFVVRFADGYVRLARLAADAVARSPTMDVRGLLSCAEIREFLNGMLDTSDRRALYVAAVLTSVGWTDDKQEEGMAVARHLGLEWTSVQATVDGFHRRFSIAPRGGRYRYISPTPLGIHLAVEAWTTHPDLLKSLPSVLPSDEAREAYYERLQSMASNPQARKYARDELAPFFRIDDFVDARAVRRWSALSSADPEEAARNIHRALTGASVQDRRRIAEGARREVVWTLVRLAWRPSSFDDAVLALALLAEAENETFGNNASAEFVNRFQIFLGGTAVPYMDRLAIIDELLAKRHPPLVRLMVKALARLGDRQASRMGSSPASDELPEREWQPSTRQEIFQCVEAAITKLSEIAALGIVDIQADLVEAAKHLSIRLRESSMRELVESFFEAVRRAYPEAREPLRREIARIIYNERAHWKVLSAEELKELEKLHARFEDPSLGARLQQHVGQAPWDREEQLDLKPLAEELLSAPEVLAENWPWLTSGDARDAWRLGEALAEVESHGGLAETLPSLPGGGDDLRLLCGYISARRRALGDEWYDRWVSSQAQRVPKPVTLLFEVTLRCGATVSVAHILTVTLYSEQVSPRLVGLLAFGRWDENLPADVLEKVVRAMTDTGHSDTAIEILARRREANPDEDEHWKPMALQLVTTSKLIRSGQMVGYAWKEVANYLVPEYPREIATAILREQADRESGIWFAEYGDAADVLHKCMERAPNGVWQAMQPYLSSPLDAYRISIGFPQGVLERLPADDIAVWIAANPVERAVIIARFVSRNISNDETLASRILGEYGDNEEVGRAFFSQYISGTWVSSVSAHWEGLAESLEAVATRTELRKLRRWAADSARSLRQMAERERQREEEENLRFR